MQDDISKKPNKTRKKVIFDIDPTSIGKRFSDTRVFLPWENPLYQNTTKRLDVDKSWVFPLNAMLDQVHINTVSTSEKAKMAAATLDDALIKRKPNSGLNLRSGNGLIFGDEDFHKGVRSAGIRQEYITPCNPEQNDLVERWFRTLKLDFPGNTNT